MLKRKQFTFYRSFYETAMVFPEEQRLGMLMAIIQYALDGEQAKDLTNMQLAVMDLVKPTLDASRRKAKGGMNGSPGKK